MRVLLHIRIILLPEIIRELMFARVADAVAAIRNYPAWPFPSITAISRQMTELEFLQAAFRGELDSVRRYVEEGGDINTTNKAGMSGLMLAIWESGHWEVTRYLLENGIDPGIRQKSSGWRALTFAAVNGHAAILRTLFEHGDRLEAADWKALHFAVQYRSLDTVAVLLEHGADADIRDEEGKVPLMRAAGNSDSAMLDLLLRHGADPNLSDETGMTPLMYAAQKANIDNIRLLIAYGADVDARNRAGETPRAIAYGRKRTKIAEELRSNAGVPA